MSVGKTLRTLKYQVAKKEDFPLMNRERNSRWKDMYKEMARTGEPIILEIDQGDNPHNVLCNAHGCFKRFVSDNVRVEISIGDNNGRKALWIRLMRKDKPFEYYKEVK